MKLWRLEMRLVDSMLKRIYIGLLGIAVLLCAGVNAGSAEKFEVKNSVIYAKGKPFPLIMDFPFTHNTSRDYLRYWARMGGTTHLTRITGLTTSDTQDFTALDKEMSAASDQGIYSVVNLGIFMDYAKKHPEALMVGPGGTKLIRGYPCFLDEGYREALKKALLRTVQHVKDKPNFLGYFLQDEFSYPGWGGYNPSAVKVFQDKMMAEYGSIAALNSAWGTDYKQKDDIQPPLKPETGRRFADWQVFRRWAYTDIVRLCYETIKSVDPDHLVINSMDFWGQQCAATSWWEVPKYIDIMMRHGFGYGVSY
ncbi:MAG: beta-galactosidase, partial [bacterium]|nr:beta-galactosidase [bacterium]